MRNGGENKYNYGKEENDMEMCYDGALVMPKNYATVNDEEMTYIDAGGRAVVYGTAQNIRNKLTTIIACSLAGVGGSIVLGALVGNIFGALIGGILGDAYFKSYKSCAATAHNAIEGIISRYGKNKLCKMTTTYSFGYYCTGISVAVV